MPTPGTMRVIYRSLEDAYSRLLRTTVADPRLENPRFLEEKDFRFFFVFKAKILLAGGLPLDPLGSFPQPPWLDLRGSGCPVYGPQGCN